MTLATGQVYRLPLRGVNAYLVDDGERTLVDAGTPWDATRLRRLLGEAGLSPEDLDRVLLTHYDLDHVGGLASLDPSCPVYLAEPDASYLTGRRRPPLTNRKGLFHRLTGPLLDPGTVDPDPVEDGDRIGGFRAVRAPGHTPGHTAYLHDDLGVAILGDAVRESDGELVPPPWLLTADAATNRRSIRTLAARAGSFDVVTVGHGDPVRKNGGEALRALVAEL